MQPDPSGWGSREILPASTCAGATYETLGSTECQPIGDCSAPFPPSNATYFVSASYTAAQLDGTHYKTVTDALSHAPAGAVVAVDAGTYAEAVEIERAVTIVGRCAAQVTLEGPKGSLPGFQAVGVSGAIAISGFTVQGFMGGFIESQSAMSVDACHVTANSAAGVVADGGSMTVHASRIDGTTQQGSMEFAGAFSQSGGKIELTDVALVGNASAGVAILDPGGDVKLTSSVVMGTLVRANDGLDGSGIETGAGGHVEVTGSAIVGNHTHGIQIEGAGATATITGSVVRDTVPDSGGSAYGIQVDTGASATVDSSRISGNALAGIYVTRGGAQLTLTNSVITGTNAAGKDVGGGVIVDIGSSLTASNIAVVAAVDTGISAENAGTTATVTGSLVRDIAFSSNPTQSYNFGTGVAAAYGGKVTLTDSTIVAASTAGVAVGSACDPSYPGDCGGQVTLSKVVVLSTVPGQVGDAIGLLAQQGGWASADSCVFAGNAQIGAVFTDPGTTGALSSSILRDTGAGANTNFGYGLVVLDGASAALGGTFVRDNAGVGLAFDGAQARVDSSLVFHNPIGVYVANATLDEVPSQPDTLGASEVAISQTQFIDNDTRVSSSTLPLPQEPNVGAPVH
jgi:Right handed beta helix region